MNTKKIFLISILFIILYFILSLTIFQEKSLVDARVLQKPHVFFSASNYSVQEYASTAQITVYLSNSYNKTVSVQYKTSNGTAIAGQDYKSTSGKLTFYPGQISKSFYVTIINDSLIEPTETVNLKIYNPVNAYLGYPNRTVLNILNDDFLTVYFSAFSYSVNENASSTTITVNLSASSSKTVSVQYVTINGTAMAGQDYVTASGTLTFSPGTIQRQFDVSMIDDSIYEGNETVNLALSNPVNAILSSPSSSVLTIIDNEQPPTVYFSTSTWTVNENYGTLELWVNLSVSSSNTVSVNYDTVNGTAIAGLDYYAASGTLTFDPGLTSKMFFLYIINDSIYESTEYFYATLSNPVNANLGSPSNAKVNIIDDDPIVLPTVYFSTSTYSVNENSGSISLIVKLSASISNTVSVNYNTVNGTAIAGSDYSDSGGTLTFSPGEVAKDFPVYIINDSIYESTEYFYATLSNPVNANLGSPSNAKVNIIDDDLIVLSVFFGSADYDVHENATSAPIYVKLSTTTNNTVSVNYTTSNGTAMAGYDYVAASGTLTISPGKIQSQFNVSILDDSIYEGNEIVNLTLSNPVNAILGSPSSSVLIIIDYEGGVGLKGLGNQLASISAAIERLLQEILKLKQ